MKRTWLVCLTAIAPFLAGRCQAQVGGNAGFAQTGGRARAEQIERSRRVIAKDDHPPTSSTMFIEANVLMNVRADEYVAIFALANDGETPAECSRKMDATLKTFTDDIKALGIAGDDVFVDFIAQNRIYGFEITGQIAREKLVGFDLKKNVSIRYTDRSLLDKLVSAASRSQIFDLVKDVNKVQGNLTEEAARILKQKAARYEKLLGVKLLPPMQLYAEKFAIHYPTAMYDSYIAAESEAMSGLSGRDYTIQNARKSRTFYFNGLDADGFDTVITPTYNEPLVQFTLYLKVKYEVEQTKAK